ncbi:MAG: hypothetical protein KAI57_04795 [Candidatus Pacebacteria bacterium]|nr:hypothetical protein [Candidatus Paceibacterota bacterium]
MFRKKEILFITITSTFLLLAYPVFGASSFSIGDKLVVDILNDLIGFILSIIGKIALLMLVVGGIYYIVSGSNPDGQLKAKKLITYAILGIILTLISFAIVELMDKFFVQP